MKVRFVIFAVITTLILAACAPATPVVPTPDVLAIRTSAAFTVVAEFTLTAAAFTPTPMPPTATFTAEPPPTETPTIAFSTDPTQIALGTPAGPACDDYSFDAATVDVTILDGTAMTPGQEFVKTWKIKNTGICAWGDGYGLVYAYGDKMSGVPVPIGLVEVGQEVEVSVNFKAPDQIGEYTSAWQMANSKGVTFGKAIFVKIVVK
ncbi:MAG: hypothetical protein IPO36_17325 [Anaerolineales bacterium]|nr:hypothetical protein [Anaerolineales bacterium]